MGKIGKNLILVLLFLTLGASVGFLAYLHFFEEENLSGEWTAELNFTEEAAVAAHVWLQDIEAVSVSLEDMERHMRGLTVEVSLTLEQTSRREGSFQCGVLPESYEACRDAAYEILADAFRTLLAERLRMAGYEGETDREAVEALAAETFGMSTVSYLKTCGPALLPSLEELQAEYDGGGSYRTAGGILIRQYDGESFGVTRQERYLREGGTLVLTEEVSDDDSQGSAPADSDGRYPALYLLQESSE